MPKEDILKKLEVLKEERESQSRREIDGSYNQGYVAGEAAGIRKAIKLIQEQA